MGWFVGADIIRPLCCVNTGFTDSRGRLSLRKNIGFVNGTTLKVVPYHNGMGLFVGADIIRPLCCVNTEVTDSRGRLYLRKIIGVVNGTTNGGIITIKRLLYQFLEAAQEVFAFAHIVFAEQFIQIGDKSGDFVTNERKVKA